MAANSPPASTSIVAKLRPNVGDLNYICYLLNLYFNCRRSCRKREVLWRCKGLRQPHVAKNLINTYQNAVEIMLPLFVALGLLGRPMVLALFGFNAVAVISYPAIWQAGFLDHQLWGLMNLVVVMYGAGRWSVDQLIKP